ncbi:MAG: cytochrome P450 [Nitrospinae bacterium]|nr:cytochrome P450 [Nitrospinota bacterium]
MVSVHEDLLAPDAVEDPYTYFGKLREEDPVHWNPLYETWVITRYDEVVWALRHPEFFSSEVFLRDPRPPYPTILDEDTGLYDFNKTYLSHWFIRRDPPDHGRMRKIPHLQFSPKYIEQRFRTMVQDIIQSLVQQVGGKGEMDVIHDFAAPLPILVIAEWLGFPREDREFLRQTSRGVLAIDEAAADRNERTAKALLTFKEYINPFVEERLAHPRDDLLSLMAAAEGQGGMARDEIVGNLILLLIAGHQTTINLIANSTLALMRYPEQWERFKRDPALTVRATEELLRYDGPVKRAPRIAAEDIEMHGRAIRKAERVLLVLSSANRDPRQFADPDRLDLTRHPNPHVAFGGGIHHCLGVNLAKLEGQEAMKALVQRFPPFSLATEQLAYQPLLNLRALTGLSVSWT